MIQFRRGKTDSWRKNKFKLSAGQPGYDKDKHKIKIGDGDSYWTELPYASGLFEEDIFNSETKAKARYARDSEDTTIITYGTGSPDKNTVGKLYLQCYESEPEVDYVVEAGVDGIWTYRKWRSGFAECYGALELTAAIQTAAEGLALYYDSTTMTKIAYPISFISAPNELVSLRSPSGLVWLSGRSNNSTNKSGAYNLISIDRLTNATYTITFNVTGYWR